MKKILIIFIFTLFIPWQAFSQTQAWHSGLFRVNTTISAGEESIETIASKAERNGMEFVVFSDQFLVKGEYGLLPFRNLLCKSMARKSITTYGIEEYLDRIESAGKKYPGLTLIPGADIAPHYYWTGSPFKNNLTTHQFSEQLTVFGAKDPVFYRKLPVIHNDYMVFSFLNFIFSCSPILISVIGALVLLSSKKPYYVDAQENKYYKHRKLKLSVGAFLILTGILWCADNRPLTYKTGFNQYSDSDALPYQKVIDYVRSKGGDSAGITWSCPEAKMRDKIYGINLISAPYLDDIERTADHNGFAGIYGDAFHAHEVGNTWDKILMEYCSGKRKVRPVIVGEADYHGRVDIKFIQTVINCPKVNHENIMYSLLEGRSYAVSNAGNSHITIENASVENGICISGPGEIVKYSSRSPVILNIKGKVEPQEKGANLQGEIRIILDGREITRKLINVENFALIEQLPANELDKNTVRHYVRFYIKSPAGLIICNPIFIDL